MTIRLEYDAEEAAWRVTELAVSAFLKETMKNMPPVDPLEDPEAAEYDLRFKTACQVIIDYLGVA